MLFLFIFCYPLETLNYGERSLVMPLPIYPKNIRQVQTTVQRKKRKDRKRTNGRKERKLNKHHRLVNLKLEWSACESCPIKES